MARSKALEQYDRPELWGPDSGYADPIERERAQVLLEHLRGVGRLLDVGCGDGTITNVLAEHMDVTGADIAPAALAHVRAPTVVASAEDLPFPDRSFEAVLLAEVLEHLDDEEYAKATREAARVAERRIVVTVPNRENLRASHVRCPRCREWFSPHRHLRSFSPRTLRSVFAGFRLTEVRPVGPRVERLTTLEARFRRALSPNEALPFPAICPNCGLRGEARPPGLPGYQLSILRRLGVHHLLRPVRRRRWLLAGYERR